MTGGGRAVEVEVVGRVQGVGFRLFAAREAERLGLAGWVRNEPSGTVRLRAEGPDDAVEELVRRLHQGPPSARVDRVEVDDRDPEGHARFRIAD